MSPTAARTTLVVVVLGLVGLLGVRMVIGTAQWAECTGSYRSGAVLSFQHLGAAPSLGDCILHGLGRSAPPRSTASPTTLPTPDTSLPTPEELYGAEAGAACRHEHETWSEVFNQLFEKYGSHAAFPGPGENSDGDRYAAVHGLLTDCLARFGVPPPSY
jgi:hypothetical protein